MSLSRKPNDDHEAWLRQLRAFFMDGPGRPSLRDDMPDAPDARVTVGQFMEAIAIGANRCRCLVCRCVSLRTIENPVVCRECARGSHAAPGGVL